MTQPTYNQRDWAEAPTFEALPYRLTDAVPPVSFTGHQRKGVMYKVIPCNLPGEYAIACSNDLGAAKTPNLEILYRATDPFVIYSWLDCGFVGEPPAELRADTLAAHERNRDTKIEQIFWTGGDFGTSQHLSADTEVVVTGIGAEVPVLQTAASILVTGGAVDVVEAIGRLEGAMATCYGGTAYLHVPRQALADLCAQHLVYPSEDGKRLLTKLGSVVIPYALEADNITGPDGTPAAVGNGWFYATGALKVWAGDVKFTARDAGEALVRSNNDTVLIAEQWVMVGWDCCHFAIEVSLGGEGTGEPGSAAPIAGV